MFRINFEKVSSKHGLIKDFALRGPEVVAHSQPWLFENKNGKTVHSDAIWNGKWNRNKWSIFFY